MISTLLAEDPHLARVALWAAVGVAIAVGWLLYRVRARRTLAAAAAVAFLGALAVTLYPDGAPRGGPFCTVQFSAPFTGLDTLANSVLLLPLALFGGLATRRPWPTLAGVAALSAAIELTQALAPGLGRSCDTDDWWLNTVGALVRAAGAAAVLALDRRATATAAGGAPRPGGSARPGGAARPGGSARPGDEARSGGSARPGDEARPGGSARPGDEARPQRPRGTGRTGGADAGDASGPRPTEPADRSLA